MLRKRIFYIISVLVFNNLVAQTSENKFPYPHSYVDIGIGVGPNHGMYGGQTILGYKGSGLLLALGRFSGGVAYAAGLQFGYQWFFINFSRGVIGYYKDQYNYSESLFGNIFMMGGKVNLEQKKNFYLQLGIGYAYADEVNNTGTIEGNSTVFTAGLGYRIPFKKAEPVK